MAAMDPSLLSITTTLLVGAGCFAIGYLLGLSGADHGGGGGITTTKRSCSRLLSWVRSAVATDTKSGGRAVSFVPSDDEAAGDIDDDDDCESEEEREEARQQHRRENWKRMQLRRPKVSAPLKIESLAEIFEDFKMVLVVRNDLKMGKGKIAAQCSHATLGLYKKLLHRAPKSLRRWEMCGQVKVVLKSEGEEDLLVLQARARSLKLPSHITIDAGRTQIAPNSRTVMCVFGPTDLVDDVTGGLKLL